MISWKIALLIISLILLTGCNDNLKSYDSLSEAEVIEYTKNVIYNDIGEEVDIEIDAKYQESVCDAWIDATCFGKHEIPNTYTYNLIISLKNDSSIKAEGNKFTDSYMDNNEVVAKDFDYKPFKKAYAYATFKADINAILSGLTYNQKGNNIYILSDDTEYLHNKLFTHILNISYVFYDEELLLDYDFYVIKNADLFNYVVTSEFDNKGIIDDALNIKSAYGYDINLLNYTENPNYDYVFFRYSFKGCTGKRSCSIVYGINQVW